MNKTIDNPNKRKTQAEQRRLQILDIALDIFAAKGYEATSIKDIAGAAGISQGLLYHYFTSKEALLEATIEHHSFLPQLRRILTDNADRSIREVLEEIARKFLDLLDSKGDLVKIIIHGINTNSIIRKAWANICREGSTLIQEYLEAHIKKGELRRHNVEVTARSVFSIIFMYHFTEDVFQSSKLTRQEFINEALSNILRGVGGI